jgi:lysozyme family protein
MAEFNLSLQKTLAHEGGYSNDPDDSGKETYRGISRVSHVRWTGWKIIDQLKSDSDFPSNLLHNAELQKQVELFYQTNFWSPLNANQISNQMIADSIFDFGVNAGLKTSVRMIQAIVGTRTDGILGELTLQKLNSLDFNYVLASFTVGKLEYYIYCVKKRPVNMKYLYGWVIRALSFND